MIGAPIKDQGRFSTHGDIVTYLVAVDCQQCGARNADFVIGTEEDGEWNKKVNRYKAAEFLTEEMLTPTVTHPDGYKIFGKAFTRLSPEELRQMMEPGLDDGE